MRRGFLGETFEFTAQLNCSLDEDIFVFFVDETVVVDSHILMVPQMHK